MNATNRRTNEVVGFRTNSVEVAASRLGRRLRVTMQRATGDPGRSGVFQGYVYDARLQALNSRGDNWHIG